MKTLYHGTMDPLIGIAIVQSGFKIPSLEEVCWDMATSGRGVYLSHLPEIAEHFAEPRGALLTIETDAQIADQSLFPGDLMYDALREEVLRLGYDGVHVHDATQEEPWDEVCVYRPEVLRVTTITFLEVAR